MRRAILLLTTMVVLYGCGQAAPPEGDGRADAKKPDKVVVNEGLNKKEEEELSRRLEELESKVEENEKADAGEADANSQEGGKPEEQPTPGEGSTEDDVVDAVEAYYQAVHSQDWSYTYENLDAQTRALFDEEEWYSKNQYYADVEGLGTPSIDVQVNDDPSDPLVGVTVYRAFDDGTSIDRDTVFVWEDGAWKHRFVGEELALYMPEASYDEFVAAQQESSPSAESASPEPESASPASEESAGTKQVRVVVTSDVPVDVSIIDDNFDVSISEEISGSKTYEFDIAADSGLLVDAVNLDMSGNVSIVVYENGVQKTQDSDSSGYAQVMY